MHAWWIGYVIVTLLVLAVWWIILSTDRPDLVLGDLGATGVVAQRNGPRQVIRVYQSYAGPTSFHRHEWPWPTP